MARPTLYVKRGCPYCKAATKYLDQQQVSYETVEVRGDPDEMRKLEEVSGQTKTPTMVWDGDVLSDFGTEELATFVRAHRAA
ncbi:MAG: glutaredoxin family protein [Chthoniobacterales bacterium]|nr:glutaredoxin family protein [Chthoniobacterales bacterium]